MVNSLHPPRLQIHLDAVLQLRERFALEIVAHQERDFPRSLVDLYQVCLRQVAEQRPRAANMPAGAWV